MKNSRIFKMLVVAFAFQGTQLLSLPVYKVNSNGGDCYELFKEKLNNTANRVVRQPIIKALLTHIQNEKSGLSLAWANAEFDVAALKKEIQETEASLAKENAKKEEVTSSVPSTSILSSKKLKVAAGTTLLVVGALAAYKNKEALKAQGKVLLEKGKELGAKALNSEQAKKAAEKLASVRSTVGSTVSSLGSSIKSRWNSLPSLRTLGAGLAGAATSALGSLQSDLLPSSTDLLGGASSAGQTMPEAALLATPAEASASAVVGNTLKVASSGAFATAV